MSAGSTSTSFFAGSSAGRPPAFEGRELRLAVLLAFLVQVVFFALLAFFGDSRGLVRKEPPPSVKEIPIAVQPVLDELPLLKLGSKKKVKPRLPDMWKKRAPAPVKRYEERSAPSAEAPDDVEEIPESKLADKKHEAPPEDAELVKELDEELDDPDEDQELPEYDEEGAEDGSEFGTETDPLKARQIDLYRAKIAAWFIARFTPPTDQVPCDLLKTLSAGVVVNVGGNRTIAGFSLAAPSGNAAFDNRVKNTLSALIGEQLPPPPPLYPDILSATLTPRFSGRNASCQSTKGVNPQAPSEGESGSEPTPAAPEQAAPEAPPTEPAPVPAPEATAPEEP